MKKRFLSSLILIVIIPFFHGSCWSDTQPTRDNPPKAITIDDITQLYTPVSFNHQLHMAYAACSECHHHTAGSPPSRPYCSTCHKSGKTLNSVACRSCHLLFQDHKEVSDDELSGSLYHIDIPGIKGAYHLLCIDCHDIIGIGPTACTGCHALTREGELFFKCDDEQNPIKTSPIKHPVKAE